MRVAIQTPWDLRRLGRLGRKMAIAEKPGSAAAAPMVRCCVQVSHSFNVDGVQD